MQANSPSRVPAATRDRRWRRMPSYRGDINQRVAFTPEARNSVTRKKNAARLHSKPAADVEPDPRLSTGG